MADAAPGVVAPIEPVAPAPQGVPDPSSTAEHDTEAPAGGDKPDASQAEKTLTQSEVNKIVAKARAQESRRAEKLANERAEALYYKRLYEQSQAKQPDPPEGEPQQKDFTDYEEFLLAKAEWRFEKKQAASREKSEREGSAQREQRGMAEYAQQVRSKMNAAAAKYDDFQDVIDAGVFTQPMTAFIAEVAKDPGELAYHLGNHREEAIRISQLPPAAQIVQMHLLEAKMTAAPAPTKAPAPIVPNGGQARVTKDWNDMTTAEHVKAYHDRKRKR